MRLDELEKGKRWKSASRVQISRYAVLAHQDRRMRIVNEIAGEPGKLGDKLRGDSGVAFGGDKDPEPGE